MQAGPRAMRAAARVQIGWDRSADGGAAHVAGIDGRRRRRGVARPHRRRPARLAARRRRVLRGARAGAARARGRAALIGVDATRRPRDELDLLRERPASSSSLVPLGARAGLRQRRDGRRAASRSCRDVSDPLDVPTMPARRGVGGRRLDRSRPVAAELPDAWAAIPADGVARRARLAGAAPRAPGGRPGGAPCRPRPSPLVERADLVGVGDDDVERGTPLEELAARSSARAPRCSSPTARAAASRDRGGADGPRGRSRRTGDPDPRRRRPDRRRRHVPRRRASRHGSTRRILGGRASDDLDLRFAAAAALARRARARASAAVPDLGPRCPRSAATPSPAVRPRPAARDRSRAASRRPPAIEVRLEPRVRRGR